MAGKIQEPKAIATHVLAVMARSLTSGFCYPIAYFPTKNIDGYQLVPIIWEAVMILEMVGVQVRALVCDGASQNRKFFKLHEMEDNINKSCDGTVYWVYNRFAEDERKIFFIRDPPHLMKTLRNNIENSNSNSNTRHLMVRNRITNFHSVFNFHS